MIHLYGVALSDLDARQLVALLRANGSADAVEAAAMIARALTDGRSLIRLTPPMREAVRGVLDLPEPLLRLRERLEHTTLVGRQW